jgi:hypothetical protein
MLIIFWPHGIRWVMQDTQIKVEVLRWAYPDLRRALSDIRVSTVDLMWVSMVRTVEIGPHKPQSIQRSALLLAQVYPWWYSLSKQVRSDLSEHVVGRCRHCALLPSPCLCLHVASLLRCLVQCCNFLRDSLLSCSRFAECVSVEISNLVDKAGALHEL